MVCKAVHGQLDGEADFGRSDLVVWGSSVSEPPEEVEFREETNAAHGEV